MKSVVVAAPADPVIFHPTLHIADINDPANGHSIFQAAYTVQWRSRLSMPPVVDIGSVAAGASANFVLNIQNIGPDPITIVSIYNIDWTMDGGPDPEFGISTATPVVVPAMSGIEVLGSFVRSVKASIKRRST